MRAQDRVVRKKAPWIFTSQTRPTFNHVTPAHTLVSDEALMVVWYGHNDDPDLSNCVHKIERKKSPRCFLM